MSILVFFLSKVIEIYIFVIIANALMSWLPGANESKFGQLISRLAEPYLNIFRFLPSFGGIDFSPVLAIIVLELAQQGLARVAFMFV